MKSAEDRIKQIVTDTLPPPFREVKPDEKLGDIFDMIEQAVFLMAIEDAFGLWITSQDEAELVTVKDVIAYVVCRVEPAGAST